MRRLKKEDRSKLLCAIVPTALLTAALFSPRLFSPKPAGRMLFGTESGSSGRLLSEETGSAALKRAGESRSQQEWPTRRRQEEGDPDPATETGEKGHRKSKDSLASCAAEPSGARKMEASEEESAVAVYIVGAVRRPGVYPLGSMKYLYQLVEKAGGLREDAASREINLAQRIEAMKRYDIPSEAELRQTSSGEKTSLFERENAGAAELGGEEGKGGVSSTKEGEPANFAEEAAFRGTKVDLNRVTREELCRIKGIGEKTAEAILAYRERRGGFGSVEELGEIKGIKGKRLRALRVFFFVEKEEKRDTEE